MRVLFDTNVVLDAAVPERTYHEIALALLSHADRGRIAGLVAPVSIATCWYVATAHHGVDPRPLFRTLEAIFGVIPMRHAALRKALDAEADADFEDAYLAAAGTDAGADFVVTRNERDFGPTGLTPRHPRDLLQMLTA
jgi:predicted nucleic acid-binding protein